MKKVALSVGLGLIAGVALGFAWGRLGTGEVRFEAPLEAERRAADPGPARSVEPRPSLETNAVVGMLQDLDERLARIEDTVARGRSENPRSPAGSSGDGVQALLARVEALAARLEEHADVLAEVRADASWRDVDALREAKPEVDWIEVERLLANWSNDPEGTRSSVRLLPASELLRRFGSPTELWNNAEGLHWFYQRAKDPASERFLTEVYFRLTDGRVTLLDVRDE